MTAASSPEGRGTPRDQKVSSRGRAVAKRSDIPKGGMKIVTVGKVRVALCDVDGELFAIEDICTHDDGPLGEGTLKEDQVECPRHGARFDVKTGAAVGMPAVVPVKTFPVKIEGDEVHLDISE